MEVEGDLLVVRLSGEFTLSDIREFYAIASELGREQEIYCIGDMVKPCTISTEARRYGVRSELKLNIVCTAVFGINPVMRVLLVMLSRAAHLLGRSSSEVGIKFFANETQARGFVTDLREQRRTGAVQNP